MNSPKKLKPCWPASHVKVFCAENSRQFSSK